MRGIILPPLFTFNVLKLSCMILFPEHTPSLISWGLMKKELLSSLENLKRKYETMKVEEFEEEEIERLEREFQEAFGGCGRNIEGKAELYGSLVQKLCRFCLGVRTVVHGSKFLRS
jgi:hypothetical protein